MSENKYPIGGYAPGGYMRNCGSCGTQFLGDKRAFQCEPCALKSQVEWDALTPEQQEERQKRNVEIYNEFIKKNSSTEQLSGADQVCGKTELNNLATVYNCPVCKSENTKDASIRQNNGVIGPGFASWIVDEKWICNDCGVYFKPINK